MVEAVAVLDVGKTHTKLTLVGHDAGVLATRSLANASPMRDGRQTLDAERIEAWVLMTLRQLAQSADIVAVAPVGHGAAAALIESDRLAAPVMDYEAEPPTDVRRAYDAERDPFELTGSPRLPLGLNLGQQLFWQEQLYADRWPGRAEVLLWPQYWAWRLSGERASEVSSLGCHTDLWKAFGGGYAPLAERRGWAPRFPQLQAARAALGHLRAEIGAGARLKAGCAVVCGLHDSNASLCAARAFPEVEGRPFTLVSTGTWFVTFQSGGGARKLDPARDTLANVDIEGRPVASARFMGGREYEQIVGEGIGARAGLDDAARIVEAGVRTRPSFAPGGPFPGRDPGAIVGAPSGTAGRAALASLHLALMTDAEIDLVGGEGPIVVEGRFAGDGVFTAALAALRGDRPVYVCPGGGDAVAIGAARLVWPHLRPPAPLERARSAPFDMAAYAFAWREGALGNPVPTRA